MEHYRLLITVDAEDEKQAVDKMKEALWEMYFDRDKIASEIEEYPE